MVRITLPDGAERSFNAPIAGSDLAASIAPTLHKKSIAMLVDGKLTDLSELVDIDAGV